MLAALDFKPSSITYCPWIKGSDIPAFDEIRLYHNEIDSIFVAKKGAKRIVIISPMIHSGSTAGPIEHDVPFPDGPGWRIDNGMDPFQNGMNYRCSERTDTLCHPAFFRYYRPSKWDKATMHVNFSSSGVQLSINGETLAYEFSLPGRSDMDVSTVHHGDMLVWIIEFSPVRSSQSESDDDQVLREIIRSAEKLRK